MGLGVNAHPGAFLDGVAVAGQDLRLQLASALLTGASPSGTTGIAARPGVRYGTGSPLLVQASSGMNITVNAGVAFVQGTSSATAGMYTCCLDTTSTLTVATSDPTNPRIDNVICQITDVGTSSSTTVVTLQTGTPAPSPVAPPLPANSLLLATIAVGAGVSSITAANITDARVYTSATGGIVPMANTTGGISGPAGTYAQDLSTGRLRVSDGSGNARQPKTAAFGAVSWSGGGSWTVSNGYSAFTGSSLTVTVDGATELQIFGRWNAALQTTLTAGVSIALTYYIDGAQPASAPQPSITFDGASSSSGYHITLMDFITPAAGTHTFSLVTYNGGNVAGITVYQPYFRVAPSLQQ